MRCSLNHRTIAGTVCALLAISVLVTGCHTSPPPQPAAILAAEQVVNVVAAVGVEEAYVGNKGVFLKYRAVLTDRMGDTVLYARALWEKGEDPLDGESPVTGIPLEFQDVVEWKKNLDGAQPVPIHDQDHWKALEARFMDAIVPPKKGEGVAVGVGDRESFYYRDAKGHLVWVLMEDKPSDVRLVKTYGSSELKATALATLQDYLKSIHDSARRGLFETGHYDYASWPFTYADLDRQIVTTLELPLPASDTHGGEAQLTAVTVNHLFVRTPVMAALRNPVSTSNRLVHLLGNDAYDAVKPTSTMGLDQTPVPALYAGPGMDLEAWEKQLDELTGSAPSSGTIRLLVDGEAYFPVLIDEITRAEDSVHIRMFLFDNDDFAVKIADLLKRRSEDLDVRVLLDGMGTYGESLNNPASMPENFQPPPSIVQYFQEDSKVAVRVQNNPFFTADHVKTIVIDHKLAFTGGMNIGREYRYEWHDLMMEVRGPIVDEIRREFHKRWHLAGPFGDLGYMFHVMRPKRLQQPEPGKSYPIRALYTRPGDSELYRTQVEAIRAAKGYVYIHNPYFSDELILREVMKARHRGVDVRVIITVGGNHEVMNKNNVMKANEMFKHGIRVFLYPGMSHVKAAIYDGWACLGSANFDKLSFRDNLEMNLATSHPETVQALREKVFNRDFEKSVEMTESFPTDWSTHLADRL